MRTEITIEDSEILVVRRRHYVAREYCAECACEVSMITPEHAALLAFRDTETIYSWMRLGKIHLSARAGGGARPESPLVCLNSVCRV